MQTEPNSDAQSPAPVPAAPVPAPPPPPKSSSGGEAAPASASPEQERALFFGISSSRLRSRARWGLVLLLVSFLIPHDMIGKTPIFAWDVFPEVSWSSRLALLALPLAAVAIALGLFLTKRGVSFALLVLGSLLSAAVVRKLGADRAAWDLVRVPDAFSTRPAGAIVAIALTSAAANLKFRKATRHVVPYVLGIAGASALYFYAWPERGEAPFKTILRSLRALPDLPDFRYQLGLMLVVFVTIWPLVVTLMGLSLIRYTPSKDESWLSIVACWSMSLWMFLLATRALMAPQAGLSVMAYLLTILVVTAAIVLTAGAVVVAVEGFFVSYGDEVKAHVAGSWGDDEPESVKKPKPKTLPPRTAAIVAGAAVVVIGLVELVLSRPPQKGTDWELTEPTPKTDAVFQGAFDRWAYARRSWDLSTRASSGNAARVEVKAAGKELVDAAKQVDAGLGEAMSTLVSESDDLDLGGRKWSRLVHGVNEASRKAKLPYYIDPDFFMREEKTEVVTHFFAHVYRIEKVHQWDVDGEAFATLLVRRLDAPDAEHFRLGFSRDEQPFAIVNAASVSGHASDMSAIVRQGFCTDALVLNTSVYSRLGNCGAMLKAYAQDHIEEIPDAILAATERHELQHQIDGPHLPLAGRVIDLLEGYDPSAQDRVNREASAFLAELTTKSIAPKLTLVMLAQHIFASQEQKGVYAKTAIVVLEALSGRSIRRGSFVDGDKFWAVYDKLFEEDDDKLRARAKEAWEEMFDTKLPQPKLK